MLIDVDFHNPYYLEDREVYCRSIEINIKVSDGVIDLWKASSVD